MKSKSWLVINSIGGKKVNKAKAQVTIPLDISEDQELKNEMDKDSNMIITVESTKKIMVCHRCGKIICLGI